MDRLDLCARVPDPVFHWLPIGGDCSTESRGYSRRLHQRRMAGGAEPENSQLGQGYSIASVTHRTDGTTISAA